MTRLSDWLSDLWHTLMMHPLWLGVAALGIITLAMLWRIIHHAQQSRHWQRYHQQQGCYESLDTAPPASETLPTSHTLDADSGETIAEEAALLLVRADIEQLSLQSYEDMQQSEQTEICLVDIHVHLSNLGTRALQLLELELYSQSDSITIDIPTLIASESSVELNQRFRYAADNFERCVLRYSKFASEQAAYYQLDCPVTWQVEQGKHDVVVREQKISRDMFVIEGRTERVAEGELESQSEHTPAPATLPVTTDVAELRTPNTLPKHPETPSVTLAETSLPEILVDTFTLPDTSPDKTHTTATEAIETEAIEYMPTDNSLEHTPNLPQTLAKTKIPERTPETIQEAEQQEAEQGEKEADKDQHLYKALEQWYADNPHSDSVDQDNWNIGNTHLPESYKRYWNQAKSRARGSFPKEF